MPLFPFAGAPPVTAGNSALHPHKLPRHSRIHPSDRQEVSRPSRYSSNPRMPMTNHHRGQQNATHPTPQPHAFQSRLLACIATSSFTARTPRAADPPHHLAARRNACTPWTIHQSNCGDLRDVPTDDDRRLVTNRLQYDAVRAALGSSRFRFPTTSDPENPCCLRTVPRSPERALLRPSGSSWNLPTSPRA